MINQISFVVFVHLGICEQDVCQSSMCVCSCFGDKSNLLYYVGIYGLRLISERKGEKRGKKGHYSAVSPTLIIIQNMKFYK